MKELRIYMNRLAWRYRGKIVLLGFFTYTLTACTAGGFFGNKNGGKNEERTDSPAKEETLNRSGYTSVDDFMKAITIRSHPESSRLIAYDSDELIEDIDANLYDLGGIALADIDYNSEKEVIAMGLVAVDTYSTADFNAMDVVMSDDQEFYIEDDEYLPTDLEILAESIQSNQEAEQSVQDDDLLSDTDQADDLYNPIDDDVFTPTPDDIIVNEDLPEETPVQPEQAADNAVPQIDLDAPELQTTSVFPTNPPQSSEELVRSQISSANQSYGFPEYKSPEQVEGRTETKTLSDGTTVAETYGPNAAIKVIESKDGRQTTLVTQADGSQAVFISKSDGESYHYALNKDGSHGINVRTEDIKDFIIIDSSKKGLGYTTEYQNGKIVATILSKTGEVLKSKTCEGANTAENKAKCLVELENEQDQVMEEEEEEEEEREEQIN